MTGVHPGDARVVDLLVQIGRWTGHTMVLPIAVFFPTGRCNSRCASCDWWQTTAVDDLSVAEIDDMAAQLRALGTRLMLFSGGEPLLRSDVFEAAHRCVSRGLRLHLHTSGLHLEKTAPEVARYFSRVIVSLDGATEAQYQRIRGVNGLATLERGVARLRRLAPELPVVARTTLHRLNFRDVSALVEHARAMALDGISFLAADTVTSAFGRSAAGGAHADLALAPCDVAEFAEVIEALLATHADDVQSGFILESPARLRRLPQYYAALAGLDAYPEVACNAPEVSIVIEADGTVRPCFFHAPIGSLRQAPLQRLVHEQLTAFRRTWNPDTDVICGRCVCSLRTSWRSAPWH